MIRNDEAFWSAVEGHSLELPYCTACARYFFYPRAICPHCWSSQVERRPVSGRGAVWSHVIVRFPVGGHAGWKERLPYVVALVELEEGVRIMSNVVGCAPEDVRAGMPVEVTFQPLDGRILHAFAPREPAG
jgi:uncharacterized OB-fold protein